MLPTFILYGHINTSYPVLSAVTWIRDHIDTYDHGEMRDYFLSDRSLRLIRPTGTGIWLLDCPPSDRSSFVASHL